MSDAEFNSILRLMYLVSAIYMRFTTRDYIYVQQHRKEGKSRGPEEEVKSTSRTKRKKNKKKKNKKDKKRTGKKCATQQRS